MSDRVLFDRLRYLDKLKGAGIPEDHARAHADAMDEALRASVVTVPVFQLEIRQELLALEHRLTLRVGGMLAVAVGVLLTALKFFVR